MRFMSGVFVIVCELDSVHGFNKRKIKGSF